MNTEHIQHHQCHNKIGIAKHFCVYTSTHCLCCSSLMSLFLLFPLQHFWRISITPHIVSSTLLSLPPQEPTHFDADAALIQEDMEVMSDFELHRLCQQYSSIGTYQLETSLLLDSGKFHHLTELLASLKNKVNTNVQNHVVIYAFCTQMYIM